MSKLLFLFSDCEKFVVRVEEKGFIETCLSYGVAPCKIAKLNGISEDIRKNCIIYIERSKGANLYVVKVADTIQKISERFSVSEKTLCEHNQITYVYPYQVIEIPTVAAEN